MSITRTTIRRMSFLSLVLVFVVILSTEAQADLYELYGFEAISDNSGISGTIAAQLSLEVTDAGSNQVLFTFYNDGPLGSIYDVPTPVDSTIKSVHFEDGALLSLWTVKNGLGVDFVDGATAGGGGNLPDSGDLVPPFETTEDFWARKDGSASNGVDIGEYVGILFNLESGKTFANVITAINLGFTNPDPGGNTSLRIGLHLISIGDESDAFILTPIPASMVLGMLGLGVAGLKLRKFA